MIGTCKVSYRKAEHRSKQFYKKCSFEVLPKKWLKIRNGELHTIRLTGYLGLLFLFIISLLHFVVCRTRVEASSDYQQVRLKKDLTNTETKQLLPIFQDKAPRGDKR